MKTTVISMLACATAAAADPRDRWEWTLESGWLTQVGSNTDADYEIVPALLTLRSPVVWQWWSGAEGNSLIVRSRYSVLFESIIQGPEDYHIGFNAAPSIEYWSPSGIHSVYFSIGGGAGWINSAGGTDGQRQDLTFNWFMHLGLRRMLDPATSLHVGGYFIHHSNLGMTDPNPGIDTLGIVIGISRTF